MSDSHVLDIEKVLLVKLASLSPPPLHEIGQQVPRNGACHLAVNIVPRLPRACQTTRQITPSPERIN